MARESIKLAFIAALQHLPAKQRASLILCDVLRWKASEVAELLEARASPRSTARSSGPAQRLPRRTPHRAIRGRPSTMRTGTLLARYVEAFERYDMTALTSLIQEDASQSMPPYDMWLLGRADI